MKKLWLSLIVVSISSCCFGQNAIETLKECIDSARLVKLAQKNLLRALKDDPEYLDNTRSRIRDWSYLVIPSFVISPAASAYSNSSSLWLYLKPNKQHPIHYVLAFKGGSYVGSMECSSAINFDQEEYWAFDDSGAKSRTVGGVCARAWIVLSQRRPEFIFSVRFVQDTWWFIEDDEVYVLDLGNATIHPADAFIANWCTEETIHEIAKGKRKFCR